MEIINEANPLIMRLGDTALGVQINEPNWDLTGATATFRLEKYYTAEGVAPFSGQSAVIAQRVAPAILQYSWPSAIPAPGSYAACFVVTFANGGIISTNGVLIVVDPA